MYKSCLEEYLFLFLGENIKAFLKHFRDRYAKYTDDRKGKSGDGTKRQTDLQKEIIARWNFLKPYLNRQMGDSAGVSTIVYAMYVCM